MNSRARLAAERSDGAAWINVLAGLWLIASPWIYGFATMAGATILNPIIVGVVIAIVAALRMVRDTRRGALGWINAALGAWMIASPFVYGYLADGPRTANSIIVGVIVLFVALVGTSTRAPAYGYGSGWDAGYPSTALYPPYGAFGWDYPPLEWTPRRGRGFRGIGPRGYQRSDAVVRDAICERMTDHPDLDASGIEVTVAADGVVTLQGTVGDREAKRLAEDIAESVSGVREVHNRLRLSGGGSAREVPPRAA